MTNTRDKWCTPKWLADAISEVDLDPCGSESSHILANMHVLGDLGDDGLYGGHGQARLGGRVLTQDPNKLVFVNPPYSRNQVIRWVAHWYEQNTLFLLRWDPSTAWFRGLSTQTKLVWFPDQQIDFDPPPGVKARSNPYPHALYFTREPEDDLYNRLDDLGRFFGPHR